MIEQALAAMTQVLTGMVMAVIIVGWMLIMLPPLFKGLLLVELLFDAFLLLAKRSRRTRYYQR